MSQNRLSYLAIIAVGLSGGLTAEVFAQNIPDPTQRTFWSDSYSVDGQCYCDSGFDHGVASTIVETNAGPKLVPEICAAITSTFGNGSLQGRIYYNTVQCGFGPPNNLADETDCPGIPGGPNFFAGPRCQESGATWNLDQLFPAQDLVFDGPAEEPVVIPDGPEPPTQDPVVIPQDPMEEPPTQDPNALPDDPAEESPVQDPDNPTDESAALNPDISSDETIFNACSAGVEDSDGDGFGFENGQSCLVDNTETPSNTDNSTPDIATPVEPQFPACSAGTEDNDGDGFGFENGQSCLVDNTEAPSNTDNSTPDIAAPVEPQFPICSAGTEDNDGDGFGFENGQSCLVDNTAASSNPEIATPGEPRFPACSPGVEDNDGDGFGFENGQSCLINITSALLNPKISNISCDKTAPNTTLDKTTDLIVLHFDFGDDPDDGHAAVAAKVLLDHFSIPDFWIVAGTNSRWQNNYIDAADTLMNSLFDQGIWSKANILNDDTWSQAIASSSLKWSETLNNGGDIWIAEGGPSDFTSAVLMSMESRIHSCNWQSRIHVIQHSAINESNTGRLQNDQRTNDLAYVRSSTDYINIDDGNALNATADLHANNATTAENSTFVNLALSGEYQVHWQAGFQFLGPGTDSNSPVENASGKLDFSSTVELLHILQVPVLQVSDWDDFAQKFF